MAAPDIGARDSQWVGPRSFAVGDRVVGRGVECPAPGIVVEACGAGRYRVEWQSDYLTELVEADDITLEPEE